MNLIEQLQQQAGLGGAAGVLAQDLITFYDQYSNGQMTKEEYQFLVNDIAQIRAQQDLANDEVACRWIVSAAEGLLSVV
jgi:hypothetical protein